MAKNIELLLLSNVENLGIVGDIVKVKPGYARNFLVPHGFAEPPTPRMIESLKEERVKAEKEMNILRSAREELLGRMEDVRVTLVRSCNDQGVLYGSVTQRDIADALQEGGFDVGTRSIRLAAPIRRIGEYEIPIQFDKDLRTEISMIIEPDQPLEEREEMEFDNEGNLIDKSRRVKKKRPETHPEEGAEDAEAEAQPAESDA
ncbi:MAG: 50S ribosomal protein L9 [Planctomycetota bacterium]|nr:50S ribosomal protein L9 [Planctomycetota bacterium]